MDKEKNAIWYPELDLEQKEDIYGKTDKIQIESGVWLIVMYQCILLGFNKYTM